MKKILIIITTGFANYGGLTSVMMNYYRAMNRNELQIDFASTNNPDSDSAYNYIKKYGSDYFCLGDRKKKLIVYLYKLDKILKQNQYDAVHVNGNSATMMFELLVCKSNHIPVRIAHGHTTRSDYPMMHQFLKFFLKRTYTHALAVSEKTGEWLFDKNFIILNNAIEVEKYKYNDNVRNKLKESLGLNNSTVLGNVGKLYAAKNQKFLIDVFYYYHVIIPQSKLVLVGGGELEEDLKKQCEDRGLQSDVLFLGMRNDIQEIIQTFDVFVFPSLYEGLGLALIEAQASGLKCIASDAVPRETEVTSNVRYLSLDKSAKYWAQEISNIGSYDRHESSNIASKSIRSHGYDITQEVYKLENIYRLND